MRLAFAFVLLFSTPAFAETQVERCERLEALFVEASKGLADLADAYGTMDYVATAGFVDQDTAAGLLRLDAMNDLFVPSVMAYLAEFEAVTESLRKCAAQ